MNFNLTVKSVQDFYQLYAKKINLILLSLLVVIGGGYYYFNFYKAPREEKANEAIFRAQSFFKLDSFDIALNGSGSYKGFLSVIKNYSGTKAANLAHYYAGIIYLKQGQFQKAVDMLLDFSSESNVLNAYAKGALADAYSEMKSYEKAVKLYQEVATILKDDNVWGAENLLKAALLLEIENKNDEAIKTYRLLIKNFPQSKQKTTAEQSIYRLGGVIE